MVPPCFAGISRSTASRGPERPWLCNGSARQDLLGCFQTTLCAHNAVRRATASCTNKGRPAAFGPAARECHSEGPDAASQHPQLSGIRVTSYSFPSSPICI
jgi:hypothetical protein